MVKMRVANNAKLRRVFIGSSRTRGRAPLTSLLFGHLLPTTEISVPDNRSFRTALVAEKKDDFGGALKNLYRELERAEKSEVIQKPALKKRFSRLRFGR